MNYQTLEQDTHRAEPTNEETAALAYSFFEASGRLNGHDLEHWLRAKEELSKSGSSGGGPQTNVKTVNRLTTKNVGGKLLTARTVRGRKEDRYTQSSTAR